MSAEERRSEVDRAAQTIRDRYYDGSGGTIGSAMLRAISTLRKEQHEHEALDLENALRILADVAGDHAAAEGVPAHLRDGLEAYVATGRPTGGFLAAVLRNDLCDAVGRADPVSAGSLTAVVRYLRNNVPRACWGSEKNHGEWLAHEQPERDRILRDFEVTRNM